MLGPELIDLLLRRLRLFPYTPTSSRLPSWRARSGRAQAGHVDRVEGRVGIRESKNREIYSFLNLLHCDWKACVEFSRELFGATSQQESS